MKNDIECYYPERPPIEKYFFESGVYRYVLNDGSGITGISADSWGAYYRLLEKTIDSDKIVASPELITQVGVGFADLHRKRSLIEARLEQVLNFSRSRKETLFILGTPLFVNNDKPRNSAVLIKNGEIIGVTNKRSGATDEERKCFELVAEEPPLLLPGTQTSLLICADLPTASLYSHPTDDHTDRILELSNRANLIGKEVRCIHPLARNVLMISCWGVGGTFVRRGKADEYYRLQLRNISWRLMRETKIGEIVIVDRVPIDVTANERELTPKYPYNGIIRKG